MFCKWETNRTMYDSNIALSFFFSEIHHTVEVDTDKVNFLFDVPRRGILTGKRIDKVGRFYFVQPPEHLLLFIFVNVGISKLRL